MLFDINVAEKEIILLDPMEPYVDVPSYCDADHIPELQHELNTWLRTFDLEQNNVEIEPAWNMKKYSAKYICHEVVVQACDTGVAVLTCIQCMEQDLLPVYHVTDLKVMRKKIYFNVLNGEFPVV